MTTLGLEVGVLMVLGVEIGAQIVVVLYEEVGFADTDPEQSWVLAEEIVDLGITVGIDLGMTLCALLLLIDSCREESYVAKEIRIVD